MFKIIKNTEASASFFTQVKTFGGWVMGILGLSGGTGLLTFFYSKVGIAVTCGLLVFIVGIIAFIVYLKYRNTTKENFQAAYLRFKLQKDGAGVHFKIIEKINIPFNFCFPNTTLLKSGTYEMKLFLEFKDQLSSTITIDINSCNNKQSPTINYQFKGVYGILFIVSNIPDVDGGEYEIKFKVENT